MLPVSLRRPPLSLLLLPLLPLTGHTSSAWPSSHAATCSKGRWNMYCQLWAAPSSQVIECTSSAWPWSHCLGTHVTPRAADCTQRSMTSPLMFTGQACACLARTCSQGSGGVLAVDTSASIDLRLITLPRSRDSPSGGGLPGGVGTRGG
jgi:hypothetical protein